MARGLVTDANGTILARPLPKFFNAEEHRAEDIPWGLPFEVAEKLDGSLLIVQALQEGDLLFTTRGSFHSKQAEYGERLFLSKYGSVALDRRYTYLFELIYPENRIVVDYGDREDVVLLAIIETATGEELSLDAAPEGLTVAPRLSASGAGDFNFLMAMERQNAEGFVIKFENGFRVKVKFDEYKRLHKLLTGISEKLIWEYLRDGLSIEDLLDRTPDEFNAFVREKREALQTAYHNLDSQVNALYKRVSELPTRKEQALFLKEEGRQAGNSALSAAVFRMLDGKDCSPVLWKHCEPATNHFYRKAEE